MFVSSLIVVPAIVTRIPNDYFARDRRRYAFGADRNVAIRVLVLAVKNSLGVVLLVAGVAMLVLPGQGLLSIAIAIMLLDFPGKFQLERWLVSHPPVLRSINWLRRRANRQPLVIR